MSGLEPIRKRYMNEFREGGPETEARVEWDHDVLRAVGKRADEQSNRVLNSRLTTMSADAAIDAQVRYFGGLGHAFEWTVFDADKPSDLVERLASRGFLVQEPETVMVREVAGMPVSATPEGIILTQVTNPLQIPDILEVQTRVEGEDHAWLAHILVRELTRHPNLIRIYGAFDGRTAISSAWIRFNEGKSFASLNGGSTLPEYRGLGIYRALVSKRADDARMKGVPYLTVDASPMSRPILERLGFSALCTATPCIWSPKQAHKPVE